MHTWHDSPMSAVLGRIWGLVTEVHIYAYVTWLIHRGRDVCIHDMSHGSLQRYIYVHMRHGSSIGDVMYAYVTWLMARYKGTYIYKCGLFIGDMTYEYVTWLIHRGRDICIRDMTHGSLQRCIYIYVCGSCIGDMTHAYVTWLMARL